MTINIILLANYLVKIIYMSPCLMSVLTSGVILTDGCDYQHTDTQTLRTVYIRFLIVQRAPPSSAG